MALHEEAIGKTDEWYTPKYVFDALECDFDVDVASPGKDVVPWIPAERHYTKENNSLLRPWQGFVWMNPPFGGRNGLLPWLEKFLEHGDGIALVPDRTSAPWWQDYVPQMDSVLFVAPKIKFIGANGDTGKSPAQGTCLLSLGRKGRNALSTAYLNGLGSLFNPDHVVRSLSWREENWKILRLNL